MNSIILKNLKNISKICPIKKIQLFNSEITLVVHTNDLFDVLLFLKNNFLCQFKILSCLTCVDYPKSKYRFMIIYDILSIRYNTRVKIKIFTHEIGTVSSITKLYSAAGWFENEIWDMFGVFFQNHPNLKRILTDYGFQGHPLRKDFPLSGFIEMKYNETDKRVISESIELAQEYRTFNFLSPWQN